MFQRLQRRFSLACCRVIDTIRVFDFSSFSQPSLLSLSSILVDVLTRPSLDEFGHHRCQLRTRLVNDGQDDTRLHIPRIQDVIHPPSTDSPTISGLSTILWTIAVQ